MQTIIDLATELSASDRKSLSEKGLKLAEESGELGKAILAYEQAAGCTHRFPDREKVIEECADVMLVAYSIANNVGATSDELMKMVGRKALYWKQLQDNEAATDLDNLIFEMHVTVESIEDIETFKKDCAELGVKPIILDLYADGETIPDVMTSSHFKGTTKQAAIYSRGLVTELRRMGYKVLREKIETVPWHPASKNAHNRPARERYFEAHFAFHPDDAIGTATTLPAAARLIRENRIKLSRNAMKKGDQRVVMGTYRVSSLDTTAEKFQAAIEEIVRNAEHDGVRILEKPITEFALFDTNDQHDKVWIG